MGFRQYNLQNLRWKNNFGRLATVSGALGLNVLITLITMSTATLPHTTSNNIRWDKPPHLLPTKNTHATAMEPATVPKFIALVRKPRERPSQPGFATCMAMTWRAGMIRCSPRLHIIMKPVTKNLLLGTRSNPAPTMEIKVPIRMMRQSDTRCSKANSSTRIRPGNSRKNSSKPLSTLSMAYISDKKLLMVAAKQPVPTPQTKMLRKNAPAPERSLKIDENCICVFNFAMLSRIGGI